MRLSVVIATHNRASLLAATLEQLRHQTFEPGDEVIVVDNASTDETPDVISRAATGFPIRCYGIYEARPGKTPALNAGIAAAHGDILALTDDDVLVADDWIATIRRIFGDPSLALAGGRVDPRWERPAPRWLRVEQQGRYGPMSSPLALLHYGDAQELGVRTAVGANLVARRSVVDSLGGFAAHLGRGQGNLLCGEDHDFCQRAVAAGYRCEYRPELRVRHWVPAGRMRLRYYLRWFFWSGVTTARIERATETAGPGAGHVWRHYLRRLLRAPVATALQLAAGRPADAAEQAVDGAFALGYLAERIRDLRRGRAPHAAPPGGFRAGRPGFDQGGDGVQL